jgi:hypothetical protein
MSGPTFPIGAMINEMFVLAFLVVVESVRLLLGQQHEPVSSIKLFKHMQVHSTYRHEQIVTFSIKSNNILYNILQQICSCLDGEKELYTWPIFTLECISMITDSKPKSIFFIF